MSEGEIFIYGFLAAVILMSGLHGLGLACVLCFSEKLNSKSNRFLALALFGISLMLIYEFIFYVEDIRPLPFWIYYFPFYLRTLIPTGLYFFVRYLIEPKKTFDKSERLFFVPLVLEFLNELIHIPVFEFLAEEEQMDKVIFVLTHIGEAIGIFACLWLLPKALKKVNHYQKFLYGNYSNTANKDLFFLKTALIFSLILVAVWVVAFGLSLLGYDPEPIFLFVFLGLAIQLFVGGYLIILKYDVIQPVPIQPETQEAQPKKKLSSKTDGYYQNLLFLFREKQLFTNPELTLSELAEKLEISGGYLSQIIREKENKNFFEFVNSYRVEAVKEMLGNEKFSHYSILGIAEECGFKTKSTFNSVFKKFTGVTPSGYKKKLN